MSSFQLNYHVLGDHTDFVYPLSMRPEISIMQLILDIEGHYLGWMGIKLPVPVRLFKIDQPQDEMADITVPTTKCLKFSTQVQDYWTGNIDPDLVHILVIVERE
jgi:hypothetical protein